MKKVLSVLMAGLLLTGCASAQKEMDRALSLRTKLLQAASCAFEAEVTADYGDKLYTFGMDCTGDAQGNVTFRVRDPETISGISGKIDRQGGALTFENTALQFGLLADGQLSPVSAPWVLLRALRGGYLTSAGMEDGLLRLSVNDSYADNAMNLDVWLDEADIPQRAEVCYDGKRILSICVENFVIS